jgi:hypothetical protein
MLSNQQVATGHHTCLPHGRRPQLQLERELVVI